MLCFVFFFSWTARSEVNQEHRQAERCSVANLVPSLHILCVRREFCAFGKQGELFFFVKCAISGFAV